MEAIDLEMRVKSAAQRVSDAGERARVTRETWQRAIRAHRAPGTIEDLEIEAATARQEFDDAMRSHYVAVILRNAAQEAAQAYAAA
jgi:hypothetical protein